MTAELAQSPLTQQRCTARSSRTGEQCKAWAIRGGTVCSVHGGRAPQVRRAAARRLAAAEAAKSIADIDVTPIDNPLVALAELAAEAAAWKQHMADTVAQLRDQYRFIDDKGAEHLDARVALLERAMDRLQRYLVDWVRLGFDERKIAMDEALTNHVAAVFRRMEAGLVALLEQHQVDGGAVAGVRCGLVGAC